MPKHRRGERSTRCSFTQLSKRPAGPELRVFAINMPRLAPLRYSQCWNGETGTATVMLLGDTCTRGCRFCAVRYLWAPTCSVHTRRYMFSQTRAGLSFSLPLT